MGRKSKDEKNLDGNDRRPGEVVSLANCINETRLTVRGLIDGPWIDRRSFDFNCRSLLYEENFYTYLGSTNANDCPLIE